MIRKIELKDKASYIAMSEAFYQSKAVLKPIKPKYLLRTLKEMISDSPYIDGFVYEIDGEVIGYMLLTFSYSNELGGQYVTIDELFIKTEFRGMNIGSEMIQFVEKFYREQRAITLLVSEENMRAKSLYESIGFKEVEYLQMIKDNQKDIIKE